MQSKHLTIEEKVRKEQEEEIVTTGKEQLEKVPKWLVDSVAKKEYKRIVSEFDKINVVGNLDLNNIAAYCNAYSFYLKATNELKGQSLTVERTMKNGEVGLFKNPLIDVQRNYADEMRKFASLCGLTIDSRLKVASVQVNKTEKTIEDDFGDI